MADMCFNYLAGPHYFGEFQDVKSEDIAEAKIEAGELKPEDTSVIDTPKAAESSKIAEAEETSTKAETEEPEEKSGSSESEGSASEENGGSSESQGEESPSDSQLSSRTKPSLKEPDDFDKYIEANGLKPLYRGYSASSEDQLEEFSNSIKNGTSKVSGEKTSAFGVGIYFASSRNEAEGYMQRRQNEQGEEFGKVSTAALDVGAKVGDYGEYEHQKFQDEWDLRGQYFELPKEAKEERQKIRDQADKLARMTVPEYAASKGCDAVYEPGFGYTIVTNPNALVVRNDSASFDGGPGSGNWGHEGVPGKLGGSAPGGGSENRVGDKQSGYTSFAKEKKKFATPHKTSKEELDKSPNGSIISYKKDGKTVRLLKTDSGDFVDQTTGEVKSSDELSSIKADTAIIIPNSEKSKYTQKKTPGAEITRERIENTPKITNPDDYDSLMRDKAGEVWKKADAKTKDTLVDYTSSEYETFNTYLRTGDTNGYSEGKVKESIDLMTDAIAQSRFDSDTFLYRGVTTRGAAMFLGVSEHDIERGNPEDFIGIIGQDDAFLSCGSVPGKGFNKTVQFTIFCPKGTQALYAEPFSACGRGSGRSWDGKSSQATYSREFETILQRGTRVEVVGYSRDKYGSDVNFLVKVVGQNTEKSK